MSPGSQRPVDNWPQSAKRGLAIAPVDPEEQEKAYRREVRRDAMRTAEGLVHSASHNNPGQKKSAVDMAKELVDAADIIENAILHRSPADQVGHKVGAAQRVALGDY